MKVFSNFVEPVALLGNNITYSLPIASHSNDVGVQTAPSVDNMKMFNNWLPYQVIVLLTLCPLHLTPTMLEYRLIPQLITSKY